MPRKDKIAISIHPDLLKWIDRRAEEWKVSRSWLIENLLYTAMIKSGIIPNQDENKT